LATGEFSTATGQGATATGFVSTATGNISNAGGDYSTATGELANAIGNHSTATGVSSLAKGTGSTATGSSSIALGDFSTAVGDHTDAQYAGSAAFGANAVTTRANQQVFGTATNSYTLPGLGTASTAAQTGPVSIVTADQSGTLGTGTAASLGLATTGDIAGLQGQINNLYREDTKLRGGIAMSSAIPTAIVLPSERFTLGADWANYLSANAIGVSGAARIGSFDADGTRVDVQAHIGAGFATDNGSGTAITKAGLRFGW
jgi:hypothetical protein